MELELGIAPPGRLSDLAPGKAQIAGMHACGPGPCTHMIAHHAQQASGLRRQLVKRGAQHGIGNRINGRRAAPMSAHIDYLNREGVTRDGSSAEMFDAESERAHYRLRWPSGERRLR
ncbi:hypothetical protein [Sphingomonas sp.]